MPIDPIYVTGHRNPDTDSVVAAMAYTALRHALGDREYEAACLGRVSAETRRVLDRFGFQPPVLITGMHTQVRDLDFDTPPVPGTGVTVDMGWKLLQQQKELAAAFHLEDRVDEVREQVLKHRQRCYPILDENEKVAGVLTRYHLLRPRRKRVVLVDHNEVALSVPRLEEAEILEIIDHHRLADIQTAKPIRVRNEPVGSTNTIIAAMFQERGLMPAPAMAGMMAAAIVSDTVMFKSPTCTERDIQMAHRLARMAGVSPEDLGRDVFSVPVEGKTAEELLFTDYKEFRIAGQELAVSQITCADCGPLLERKEEFLTLMKKTAAERKFDLVALMLTDVLRSGTRLLFVGDGDTVRQAFHVQPRDNEVFLPGILSRKKQVIPMLSALWG